MIDNVVMLSYKCIECKFTININTIDLFDILNDFSYKNVNKHNDSVKLSPYDILFSFFRKFLVCHT